MPIEVKSGKKIAAKSMAVYLDSHSGPGIIASHRSAEKKDRIVYTPLYALWPLNRYLDEAESS